MALRMQSPVGAKTVLNGQEFDYFSGCSYLGLQSHPEVIRAVAEAVQQYGMATGTSRGGYGEHPVYDVLESEVNRFFGTESMLYFASGYLGCTLLAQGLRERYDRILIDESCHFSILDGVHTAGKPVSVFRHCDPESLRAVLQAELLPGERPLILTDGVFPISGEIAPLKDYLEVLGPRDGLLVVDDAHASGVLGAQGRGSLDYWGVSDERCFSSHTLSKALGASGGIIPGTKRLMDEIEAHSKVYVAASPPPLPVAAGAAKALELARTQPELRSRLRTNVARAQAGFRRLGWQIEDTPVPILCLRARAGINLEKLKNDLFERRIAVAHVTTYSSTPPGGCLRVAIFATHTDEQIEHLLAEVEHLV